MRVWLASLVVGLAVGSSLAGGECRAESMISAGPEIQSLNDFYAPLSAYGTWTDLPQYGRCWRPAGVQAGWRPYSDGTWECTDMGWYWASDEPWAWACYHYGTWAFDATYGWVWVPGTEWAPAWVAWEQTPDYIGWAPCAPSGVVLAPSFFAFVDVRHFHHRLHPRDLIMNDPKILRQARFINHARREDRRFDGTARTVVVNPGPSVALIERSTGERFTARPLGESVVRRRAPEAVHRDRQREEGVQIPPERTGREQPRVFPTPPQMPERRGVVVPQQPSVPQVPRESPMPPAGREREMSPGRMTPVQPVVPPHMVPPARPEPRPAPINPPVDRQPER